MKNPSRRFASAAAVLLYLVVFLTIPLFVSCGDKAEQETKFPRRDAPEDMEPGEIINFRLANGITVYLQEEHSDDEIAVQVIYAAGVFHEDEGKMVVSRVLPHMMIFSPTASFEADQSVNEGGKIGRINGEVTGTFTHFDYIVPTGRLDFALQVEAERLTSAEFNAEQMKVYSEKCQRDMNYVVDRPQTSVFKYGLMALNQAYNYGSTSIPVYAAALDVTLDDLYYFHRQNYRVENMVLIAIGDFDAAEATALIKERFENITQEPPSARKPVTPITKDLNVQWDLSVDAVFFVYPGPYKDDKERFLLTMFGMYLNQQMKNEPAVYDAAKSSYSSNQSYPVGEIPFFIFVDARQGRIIEQLESTVLALTDETLKKIDERLFDLMKANMIRFVKSSMLNAPLNLENVEHFKIIGQESLNMGIKHLLREGRTVEEYEEFVRTITYEEAMQYLETRLTPDNMLTVTIKTQ